MGPAGADGGPGGCGAPDPDGPSTPGADTNWVGTYPPPGAPGTGGGVAPPGGAPGTPGGPGGGGGVEPPACAARDGGVSLLVATSAMSPAVGADPPDGAPSCAPSKDSGTSAISETDETDECCILHKVAFALCLSNRILFHSLVLKLSQFWLSGHINAPCSSSCEFGKDARSLRGLICRVTENRSHSRAEA